MRRIVCAGIMAAALWAGDARAQVDAGATDAAAADPDAAPLPPDAAPGPDAAFNPPALDDDEGCNCRASSAPGGSLVIAAALALTLRRRRS